ncbi:MAG: hypothetical protein ACT4P1_05280 [Sporichthyaceae bacterium]
MQSRRGVVLTAGATAVALVFGLTGCGSDDAGTSTPGPDTVAAEEQQARPELAITPRAYDDPFAGVRNAAATAGSTTAALASSFARKGDLDGDTDSPAARLRAELTQALISHVYLTGAAVITGSVTGPRNPKREAAIAALDAQAKSLDKLLGDEALQRSQSPSPSPSAKDAKDNESENSDSEDSDSENSDDPAEEGFLAGWRGHNDAVLSYAVAAKDKVDLDMRTARAELSTYTGTLAQYLRAATGGELNAKFLRGDLSRYVTALLTAIDALEAGSVDSYQALRAAAAAAEPVATRISRGVARAQDLTGSVDEPAAALRSGLAYRLTEHIHLVSLATLAAYSGGRKGDFTGRPYRQASVTVDDNAKDLAALLRTISDPTQEAKFLIAWRVHLRDMDNYIRGRAAGDTETQVLAASNIDGYRKRAAAFFRALGGRSLPVDKVAARLGTQFAAQLGQVDAVHEMFLADAAKND